MKGGINIERTEMEHVANHWFTFLVQKRDFDVDSLSKPELRMLLSVLEGELEARDLVIEALRVCSWVCFCWLFGP